MKTPEEFLVEKRILASTDLSTRWNINLTRDTHIGTAHDLVEVMKAYADEAVSEYKKSLQEQSKNGNGI